MAYLTILASFPMSQLAMYREDRTRHLKTSLISNCSHPIAYRVQVQPLGGILGEAIDGGEHLHEALWPPLRPLRVHLAEAAQKLSRRLQQEWARVQQENPELPADDWYAAEITKVLNVFRVAATRGECVATMLNAPADEDRASRVELPRLE